MTPINEQLWRLRRGRSGRGTHQFALNRLNLVTHLAGALNSMAGPTPEQAEKIAAADDACVMAYKALSDSKRPSVERHDLERFSRSQRAAAAFILVHPYSWRTPWSAN